MAVNASSAPFNDSMFDSMLMSLLIDFPSPPPDLQLLRSSHPHPRSCLNAS